MDIESLKSVAKKIRTLSLTEIYQAKSGHPGSSLSSADILTALYFLPILKFDKTNAYNEERDYFILSNGHACPAWYAVLSQIGFIEENELVNLRKFGHFLQGHPDKSKFPLAETSTGSLGQGICVGLGLALGLKKLKKNNKVYVLESDGEQDEGSVWEVNRIAAFYGLDNLQVIIDRNKMQIDGPTEKESALEPLDEKYQSFGWYVKKINGHDFTELKDGLGEIMVIKNQPAVLIAETIRGKGVSFMEQSPLYHAKELSEEEYKKAVEEIAHG